MVGFVQVHSGVKAPTSLEVHGEQRRETAMGRGDPAPSVENYLSHYLLRLAQRINILNACNLPCPFPPMPHITPCSPQYAGAFRMQALPADRTWRQVSIIEMSRSDIWIKSDADIGKKKNGLVFQHIPIEGNLTTE